MRSSFLDHPNIVVIFGIYIIAMPLAAAALLVSCSGSTPEEKAVTDARLIERTEENLVTFSPRAGVECYVLRSNTAYEPRVMACVGTIPTTHGN
jgi:hypothetical protein